MKVLLLATTSFPFGSAEPLLYDKLDFYKEFDQVFVFLSSSLEECTSNELSVELSTKLKVVHLDSQLTRNQKLLGVRYLFYRHIWKEILVTKKRLGYFGFQHLKVMLNAYNLAKLNEKKIAQVYFQFPNEFTSFYFHSYWCTEATIAAALLKQKHNPMHITTRMHGFDLYEERHQPTYLPFRNLLIEQLDKILFISQQGMDYFAAKYSEKSVHTSKFFLNRLGVTKTNPEEFNPVVLNRQNFHIVSCSSLIPLKRIHLLIEAISKIQQITIQWTHFGDGVLKNDLVDLAKNLLKSNTIFFDFKGQVSNSEIKIFYQENTVDLFVNTSKYEGLPISIMEAMAFGIPCIGTNVGGVSEIIDSTNGYLLEVDFEPIELAELITNFYSLSYEAKCTMQSAAYNTWKNKFNGVENLKSLKTIILDKKQECSVCLFDNVIYKNIQFDENGVCNVCKSNEVLKQKTIFDKAIKEQKLNDLLFKIKNQKNKRYDCLIGLSGGVDSSYVAYKAKEWGLNPLILHVDNGWNSELASMNIENSVKKLGFDLYTYVINWKEMQDIQLAFFKSSVVDIDLPMDNAISAINFKIARKFGIKYILSGVNTATEGWMPTEFSHFKLDSLNIKSIHKKFGKVRLKSFPIISPLGFFLNTKIYNIEYCAPLDYIEYNKVEAKKTLIDVFGWRDYGGKHYENIYTKFYQGVILPQKFKFDKRISHLSVLISSNQLSKEDALLEMKTPVYNLDDYKADRDYFIKKIGLSKDAYDQIMNQAPTSHLNFRSYVNIINRLLQIKRKLFK